MAHRSVIVQHDPGGTYSPGAEFSMLDLSTGVEQEVWNSGMRFTIKGQWAMMVGKVLVRWDGAVLKVRDQGRLYEWRVWDDENQCY